MVGQLSWLPCVETDVEPPDELLVLPVGVVVPPVEFVVPPEELVEPPVEVVVPPVEVVPPDEPVWPLEDVEPLDDPVTCVPGELVDPLPVEPLLVWLVEQSVNPGTAAKISWRSWRISCTVSGEIVLVVLSSRRSSRASTVNVVLRVFRAVRGARGEWGEPKNGNMDPSFTERETVRGVLPRDTVVAQNTRTANQARLAAAQWGGARRRRAKPGHTGKAGNSEKRMLGRTLARPRVPVRDAADQSQLCTREHAGKQRHSAISSQPSAVSHQPSAVSSQGLVISFADG